MPSDSDRLVATVIGFVIVPDGAIAGEQSTGVNATFLSTNEDEDDAIFASGSSSRRAASFAPSLLRPAKRDARSANASFIERGIFGSGGSKGPSSPIGGGGGAGGSGGRFVAYRIRVSFGHSGDKYVARRYSAFAALDRALRRHRGANVAAVYTELVRSGNKEAQLPRKRVLGRSFDRAHLKKKARQLNGWLAALLAEPVLRDSEEVAAFLSEDDDDGTTISKPHCMLDVAALRAGAGAVHLGGNGSGNGCANNGENTDSPRSSETDMDVEWESIIADANEAPGIGGGVDGIGSGQPSAIDCLLADAVRRKDKGNIDAEGVSTGARAGGAGGRGIVFTAECGVKSIGRGSKFELVLNVPPVARAAHGVRTGSGADHPRYVRMAEAAAEANVTAQVRGLSCNSVGGGHGDDDGSSADATSSEDPEKVPESLQNSWRAGQLVAWSFETEAFDISFGVRFELCPDDEHAVKYNARPMSGNESSDADEHDYCGEDVGAHSFELVPQKRCNNLRGRRHVQGEGRKRTSWLAMPRLPLSGLGRREGDESLAPVPLRRSVSAGALRTNAQGDAGTDPCPDEGDGNFAGHIEHARVQGCRVLPTVEGTSARVVLCWDNTYSKIRGKRVHFSAAVVDERAMEVAEQEFHALADGPDGCGADAESDAGLKSNNLGANTIRNLMSSLDYADDATDSSQPSSSHAASVTDRCKTENGSALQSDAEQDNEPNAEEAIVGGKSCLNATPGKPGSACATDKRSLARSGDHDCASADKDDSEIDATGFSLPALRAARREVQQLKTDILAREEDLRRLTDELCTSRAANGALRTERDHALAERTAMAARTEEMQREAEDEKVKALAQCQAMEAAARLEASKESEAAAFRFASLEEELDAARAARTEAAQQLGTMSDALQRSVHHAKTADRRVLELKRVLAQHSECEMNLRCSLGQSEEKLRKTTAENSKLKIEKRALKDEVRRLRDLLQAAIEESTSSHEPTLRSPAARRPPDEQDTESRQRCLSETEITPEIGSDDDCKLAAETGPLQVRPSDQEREQEQVQFQGQTIQAEGQHSAHGSNTESLLAQLAEACPTAASADRGGKLTASLLYGKTHETVSEKGGNAVKQTTPRSAAAALAKGKHGSLTVCGTNGHVAIDDDDPMSPEEFRQALTDFYQAYNPSKLSNIDKVVGIWSGRERLCLRTLREKYDVDGEAKPNEATAAAASAHTAAAGEVAQQMEEKER
eukprot:g1337.t1